MISVIEHDDATLFLERTRDAFERRETMCSLIYGLALRLEPGSDAPMPSSPDDAPPFLATIETADGVVGAALMTPPHAVIVAAFESAPSGVAEALVRHLAGGGRGVSGVVGPAELVREVADAWTRATPNVARVRMRQGVYELRAVRRVDGAPGRMRAAVADDVDLVVQWLLAFNREIDVFPQAFVDQVRGIATTRIGRGEVFLWEHDGAPVCMAASARPTTHGVTINAVYTPEEIRGRGYATACVAGLSQHLLDTGRSFCTLFTDLANPTSNRIYARIGYERVGSFAEYAFEASPEEKA